MTSARRLLLLGVLCSLAPAPPALAQEGAAAYVVLLGRDTLAVERVTRTERTVTGEMVTRAPRVTTRSYRAELDERGAVERFESEVRAPITERLLQRVVIRFARDSALVEVTERDSTRSIRVAAARGTVPFVPLSVGLHEQFIAQARRAGGDSAVLRMLQPGAMQTASVVVRRRGADSLFLATPTGGLAVRTDRRGGILRASGRGTTSQVEVRRVPGVDVRGMATSFAQREERGSALGVLSPRDSLDASVGGARISVSYGRPSLRGRALADVVPAGRVWRTGANQATHLRTDRALSLGSLRLAPGEYTLFTLPEATGWTLIVNAQTGQWGTAHDPARDVGRIPLRTERASPPVERFTISVEPEAAGGVLSLSWGDVRATVPVTVAP